MGSTTAIKRCILTLLLLAGCASELHVKEARRVMDALGKEIQKEHSLCFEGAGGSMPEKIEELEFLFYANRETSLEEARSIQTVAAKKILQRVNSDLKIRPHLKEHPFPSSRLFISITYPRSKKGVSLAFKKGEENIYYREAPEGCALEVLFSEQAL